MKTSQSIKHFLVVAVTIVAATIPVLLADPAVKDFIANHPAIAVYLPVVSGIAAAVYRLIVPTQANPRNPAKTP